MTRIMNIEATTPVKDLPQPNQSHHVHVQDEASSVRFQTLGNFCNVVNDTSRGNNQQVLKQKLSPKSEALVDSRSDYLTDASLRSGYVPNIYPVNSDIENDKVEKDEWNDGDHHDESFQLQRLTHSGTQDDTVSRIQFVRRWAKIHLPSDESSSQLRKKLSAITESNYVNQKFIPDEMLRKVVTAETVCAELQKSNYTNIRRIHASPVTIEDGAKYQKILAILYLIKLPSKIRKFVKYGMSDGDLPLIAYDSSKDGSSTKLRSRDDRTLRVIRFKRQEHSQDFLDNQWKVLAPVFQWANGDRIYHQRLMSQTILPFISHGNTTAQGGYSKVLKTEIHPCHHEFGIGNVFAIKVLRKCDRKAFKQEAAILGRLSNLQHTHKHLITLLATFERGEVFHFIFPWADADLFTFWKQQRDPPDGEKMDTWIIEQCHGIAEALNTIHRYETKSGTTLVEVDHVSKQADGKEEQQTIQLEISDTENCLRNLFGRHGDLKPENILWFPCPSSLGGHGILKITDFGAARFNTVNLWDTNKTGRIPNSPTYRSPEIDLHGRLTTACDVWALGCVYLEFITWFCGGNSRLEDFGQRRLSLDPKLVNMPADTFFILVREGESMKARVKPAVVDEIKKLKAHARSTTDFKTLLGIIQEDMLVVHQQEASSQEIITPGMKTFFDSKSCNQNEPIATRRKSCGNILRRIGSIKATNDQEGNFTRHNTFENKKEDLVADDGVESKNDFVSILNTAEIPFRG